MFHVYEVNHDKDSLSTHKGAKMSQRSAIALAKKLHKETNKDYKVVEIATKWATYNLLS